MQTELLPFAARDAFFVLNMPMDEQAPAGRLLRPRRWRTSTSCALGLAGLLPHGSGTRPRRVLTGAAPFREFLKSLGRSPRAIITDSRAMDVMHRMTPPEYR